MSTETWGIRPLALPHWDTTQRQPRTVVAARSRAAAARALEAAGLRVTSRYLGEYGGTTGNPLEVEVAEQEPGAVFYATTPYPKTVADWKRA